MAQIMKPEARHPSAASGTVECLPYGVTTQRATITADEHPIRTCPARHVLNQDRKHMRRNDNRTLASVSLRVGVEGDRRLQQL